MLETRKKRGPAHAPASLWTSITPVEHVQVEEIALVNCVVRRWDGARIWWPNVLLDSYPLVNLSRSNNKWESVEVRSSRQCTVQIVCTLRVHSRC